MAMNNVNRTSASPESEGKNLAEIVQNFLNAFQRLWWAAVILMIITGIWGYFNYKNSYVPVYQSEATFSIVAPEYGRSDTSYTNDSQLASSLSVSFNYLINNEIFYEIIKKDIGIDYIPATITISSVESTSMLSIIVSGADPEMNLKILNSVIDNYGDVAEFVIGDTELTMLDQPEIAKEPINAYSPVSAVVKYAFLGFLIGLIPTILYAFFVKTIASKDDIEKYLSVTCFGTLPAVMLNKKDGKVASCSILDKKVGFRYLEAMRTISSRCERKFEEEGCRVILITSTQENEGKSTFAMNLAYSLSKTQKRVMLIDGDLRKPGLRGLTGAEMSDYAMDDFLQGRVKSSEAIINLPGTRVLMLAQNQPSKHPIECLNSENMGRFIQESKDVVDYIVIDAPPCQNLSDAAVLAKYSDGVIYVVKEDFVRVNKILDTIQEFSYTRKPILGCVLNGSFGRLRLSYGYGYGYGKNYGYGYRRGYGYGYGYRRGYGYGRSYGYGSYGSYGGYGYGSYGYGYGYGEYGQVSDSEFAGKSIKVSKRIAMTTTEEQKKALEAEKQAEKAKDKEDSKQKKKKAGTADE